MLSADFFKPTTTTLKRSMTKRNEKVFLASLDARHLSCHGDIFFKNSEYKGYPSHVKSRKLKNTFHVSQTFFLSFFLLIKQLYVNQQHREES